MVVPLANDPANSMVYESRYGPAGGAAAAGPYGAAAGPYGAAAGPPYGAGAAGADPLAPPIPGLSSGMAPGGAAAGFGSGPPGLPALGAGGAPATSGLLRRRSQVTSGAAGARAVWVGAAAAAGVVGLLL